VYNPENLEELSFYFRGEKMAKVIGRAAASVRDAVEEIDADGAAEGDGEGPDGPAVRKRTLVGTAISGLLVRDMLSPLQCLLLNSCIAMCASPCVHRVQAHTRARTHTHTHQVNPVGTFNYHIYDPSELTEHTDLKTSRLTQRQVVSFPYGFPFLEHFMLLMHGNAVTRSARGRETLEVVGAVTLKHDGEARTVTLEWVASAGEWHPTLRHQLETIIDIIIITTPLALLPYISRCDSGVDC
jgi:hypothetical protein